MRVRPLAVALFAAVTLTLGGCVGPPGAEAPAPESTAPPEASYAQPEIAETAFGPYGGPDDGPIEYAWYLVLVQNPNEVALVSGARVDVDLIGAEGVLATHSQVLDLLPGVSAVWDVDFSVPAEDVVALEVEVTVDPALSGQIFLPAAPAGSFEFSDLLITPASSSDPASDVPVLSGSVENGFGTAVEAPDVVVVMRDPAGTILGSMTSLVRTAMGSHDVAEFDSYWFVGDIPADYTLEGYGYLPFTLLEIDVPLTE